MKATTKKLSSGENFATICFTCNTIAPKALAYYSTPPLT